MRGKSAKNCSRVTRRPRHSRRCWAPHTFPDSSQVMASSLDSTATLSHVVALLVPALADACSLHILAEDGTIQSLVQRNVELGKKAWFDTCRKPARPTTPCRAGLRYILPTDQSVVYPDLSYAILIVGAAIDAQLY